MGLRWLPFSSFKLREEKNYKKVAVQRRLSRTLCVRRKLELACRHLLPMGLGLACTLPPGTGWLSCTFSEQRTCDCYFSQPGHFLFLPFVVRPSGSRCQCRYRTRRSACVCSRGAPLHHTSSCCDVGLDSTSPHSLQESPPRRSPPSPTACGTHFVCDSFAVLFFFFVVCSIFCFIFHFIFSCFSRLKLNPSSII